MREAGIVRGTVILDDDTVIDEEGPEAEPGSHAVGYSLLNLSKLPRSGDYEGTLATIFLTKPYQRGDELKPLAMLKRPLQTEVRPLER